MEDRFDHLERFVRAVHRRAVFWRVVERAGVGLTVGAVAAILLLGITLSRGDDGRMIAAILVTAGAVAGLLNGVITRPTRFDATAEADRQLRLHDLLTTATTAINSTDPWANLVVAQADRRAQSLKPGDVILQRYGVRAWGGVGIVTAAFAVMSALTTTTPRDVMATSPDENSVAGTTPARQNDSLTAGSPSHSAQPFREGASADRSSMPGEISTGANSRSNQTSENTTASTGTAQGQITTSGIHGDDNRGMSRTSRYGNPVGRGNGEAAAVSWTGDASTGTVTGGLTAVATSTETVGGQTTGETSPVRLDAVPDAYRDVVRSYFDRRDGVPSR